MASSSTPAAIPARKRGPTSSSTSTPDNGRRTPTSKVISSSCATTWTPVSPTSRTASSSGSPRAPELQLLRDHHLVDLHRGRISAQVELQLRGRIRDVAVERERPIGGGGGGHR